MVRHVGDLGTHLMMGAFLLRYRGGDYVMAKAGAAEGKGSRVQYGFLRVLLGYRKACGPRDPKKSLDTKIFWHLFIFWEV